MNYENINRSSEKSSDWDSLRDVPFSERKTLSPREDSMHYWSPEYQQAEAGGPEPESESGSGPRSGPEPGPGSEPNRLETAEGLKAKHRRKLIGLLDWKTRQVSLNLSDRNSSTYQQFKSLLVSPDNPNLTPATEKSILADIKDGIIGPTDERWLLQNIASPVGQIGPEAVLSRLTNKQERRFLAEFTDIGFDNFDRADAKAVTDFIARYPTPLDFEADAEKFIREIGQANSEAKERAYRSAKETFMHKIYGKRYEYYQNFEALKKEAENLPDASEIRGEKLSKNTGYARIARRMLGPIQNWLNQQADKHPEMTNRRYDELLEKTILEHQSERLDESEDSVLIDESRQIYGIFDGAGGVKGGRAASRIASRIARTVTTRFQINRGRNLADTLTLAGGGLVRAKRNGKEVGITTGVLAKIIVRPDGQRELAYASAGDSRIYVVHANGEADQIVQDEGYENVVSNFLGYSSNRDYNDAGIMYYDHVSGKTANVSQYGEYPLEKGDRIVLCSDGITGDKGSDLMSSRELAHYVHSARTPREAAENLLTHARKYDDRSAIVVNAYPEQTKLGGFLENFFKNN